MASRGEIKNREQAKQILNFAGLVFPDINGNFNISPTDVDCLIEYHDKLYIVAEAKYSLKPLHPFKAPITHGQRLAFERMIKDLKKPAAFFLVRHDIEQKDLDVPMASAFVDWYYTNVGSKALTWINLSPPKSLRECCDSVIKFVEKMDKAA